MFKTAMNLFALAVIAERMLSAQVEPPVLLTIDVENVVVYEADTSDVSKLATVPAQVDGAPILNFFPVIWIADIVAVNGAPAKGTLMKRGTYAALSTNPSPGTGIADSGASFHFDWLFDIQQADGTRIGTVMATGWGGATKPPGSPSAVIQANMTVAGGTGAFLGVRGEAGQAGNFVSPRLASMTEDPSLRRILGGGKRRYLFHLLPMYRPQVLRESNRPQIFHSDFTLVTAENPAQAGETLIAEASGLGPTRPGVDPGVPFPLDVTEQVNSPVQVFVDGNAVEVVNSIGWPGKLDVYSVQFRMPSSFAARKSQIQISAAWVTSAAVEIHVR
jgi:hypothetical protein